MRSGKRWIRHGTFAACCVVLAAIWMLHARVLPSLIERESEALQAVSALNERIGRAQQTIAEIQARERDTVLVRSELQRLQKAFPAGAATAWLPTLAKEHFARFVIAARRIHLNGTQDEPGIPGYERGFWSVTLPVDEAGPIPVNLFLAVAEIEQRNPYVRVLDFAIRPDPEMPGQRLMSLNLTALVPK